MIQYNILLICFSDFGGYETIGGFFWGDLDLLLSSWFHPMHPAVRTAYSKYTTDLLHGCIYIYMKMI